MGGELDEGEADEGEADVMGVGVWAFVERYRAPGKLAVGLKYFRSYSIHQHQFKDCVPLVSSGLARVPLARSIDATASHDL